MPHGDNVASATSHIIVREQRTVTLQLPLPQLSLPLKSTHDDPLIVDIFAGFGGASLGIAWALGREPDIAINHDPIAIGVHAANHPRTIHYHSDVWEVCPYEVCGTRPVGLLWASPDCRHHSPAKGGRPTSKRVRSLSWVVLRWAGTVRPTVIHLENVPEIANWGPLSARRAANGRVQRLDGSVAAPGTVTSLSDQHLHADKRRRGITWRRFVRALRDLGYEVEWRVRRACDVGTPTIRTRLYLVARCDGNPIVWPDPTHGDPGSEDVQSGRLQPWRTAADIIDWSLPCPSIFLAPEEARAEGCRRPLKPATLERLATGLWRYVISAEHPYIVQMGRRRRSAPIVMPITHSGKRRSRRIDEPMPTDTTANRGEQALVAAFIAQHNRGAVGQNLRVPASTVTTRGTQQYLTAAYLSHQRGSGTGSGRLDRPTTAVTAGGQHHALVRVETSSNVDRSHQVAAFLATYYGTAIGQDLRAPVQTVTTKPRQALVVVKGQPIVDIGMRMLTPRERARAQGFPDSYILDRTVEGRPVSLTDQGRLIGNSVPPQEAAALVAANCGHLARGRGRGQVNVGRVA